MDDAALRSEDQTITSAIQDGQRVWANDVLHVWEQLYARAGDKTQRRDMSLDWADLAFQLVSSSPDCWREPLSIRLLVISRHGHVSGHPLLDGRQLIQDALEHVPWTPAEIRTLFPIWREHTPDTIRQMGRTRNILALLTQLADVLPTDLRADLDPWLEVREAARML
ncbi:hypothetical protein [uncultured Deinococcus sp.]|uniref:hypothetical protein n=1 Tax=uncultured Deinococcus sp. TaxID=158789 RepID=UPI0025E3EC3B|nr:hypothetical protein [uncultured Deinococcus sp.]